MSLTLLFLGDLVGRAGRTAAIEALPSLRKTYNPDAIIINGENAAGGFGITESITEELIEAGADAITLGNHSFDQREILTYIAKQPRLIRPINYPAGTPGRGAAHIRTVTGKDVLVINAMGRIYMDALDDPFRVVDEKLAEAGLDMFDAIFVDFHAEATSEKQAFGHHFDGRVTAVIGTHTHVPTADTMILSGGTAYQSDAGMCGVYGTTVLGFDKAEPTQRFLTKVPSARFEAKTEGEATVCGVVIKVDSKGLATGIERIALGGVLGVSGAQQGR